MRIGNLTDRLFARILLVGIVVFLVLGMDQWIRYGAINLPGSNAQYYKIVPLKIPENMNFAGEEVPLDIFYVKESLDRELSVNTYWHSATLRNIKLSHRWFPVFDTIMDQYGVPRDFKYLCLIESGLSNVVSPAGATGFWQFMKGTAKEYDLEVTNEVDERYHVIKSTHAACRYLLDSYEKYRNWTLVAASYNAGRNGINKQLERQKANSYYDLLLGEETSRYIYRILAVKLIFENPEAYGFYLEPGDYYTPIPTHTVTVSGRVDDWADFAKEHGISYKLLKYFNPWLRDNDLRNRRKKTYEIMIPDPPYDVTHEELGFTP
ncbi:MAG: lytic transglycosylase domain-containing protein [bacterium]